MNKYVIGALVESRVPGSNMKGTIIGDKLKVTCMVAVEWNDGALTKERIDDLEILDEAQEKAWREIKAKVDEAQQALNTANKLARDAGTSLSDLYYDLKFGGLFDELSLAGWSASSMHC